MTPRTARTLIASACLAASIPGCRALDPAPDLARAATAIEERRGIEPRWNTGERQAGSAPVTKIPLPSPLSVDEAIDRALATHPSIGREIARVAAARADLVTADRLPNPRLGFGVGIPIDGAGGSPGQLGLLAPLTALFTRPAQVAAADAELRAAILSLTDSALTTIATVETQCAEVEHLRLQLSLDRATLRAHDRRVTLLDARATAGEGTRDLVAAARTALARAHDRLASTRSDLARAERALLASLGAIDSATPCPPIDFGEAVPLDGPLPDETALVHLVVLRRLDVAARIAHAEAAGARVRVTGGERFGAVGGSIGFERNFSGREGVFPGLQLELPIFDLGGARIAAREAEARERVAHAEEVLRAALLEVRTAAVTVQGLADRHARSNTDWIPAARARESILETRFDAGESDAIALLDATIDRLAVERAANTIALELRTARIELTRAAGGSLAPLTVEEADRLAPLPEDSRENELAERGTP